MLRSFPEVCNVVSNLLADYEARVQQEVIPGKHLPGDLVREWPRLVTNQSREPFYWLIEYNHVSTHNLDIQFVFVGCVCHNTTVFYLLFQFLVNAKPIDITSGNGLHFTDARM